MQNVLLRCDECVFTLDIYVITPDANQSKQTSKVVTANCFPIEHIRGQPHTSWTDGHVPLSAEFFFFPNNQQSVMH